MAYEIERDEALDLSRLTFSGQVDFNQIVEALLSLRALPGHNWRTLALFDPDVEIDANAGDIRKLVAFIQKERRAEARPGRVAMFAPNDVVFGISRMHQAYSEHLPIETQVFRDVAEAIEWLRSG